MINYKDLLYYAGRFYRIIFARTTGGDVPGKDFLDSLQKIPSWGKLDRVLTRLADFGKISNKEQFRFVGDDLYEVKEPGGKRLVGYFAPGHFILTHGFAKRGGGKSANKFPAVEREKALKIRREFELEFNRMVRGAKNETKNE